MLFELKLGTGVLWGAIGQNGGLYWGALSVAKLLGYRSVYQFIRHHSNVFLKDIASSYHAREYDRLLETRLLTHNRLLSVLDRSRKEKAQLIYDHFNLGNFYVKIHRKHRFPRAELCKQSDPQAVNFFMWIEAYKHEMFEESLEIDPDADREDELVEDEDETDAAGYCAPSPPPPPVPMKPAAAADSNTMDYTPLSPPDTFQPDQPYDANDKEDTIEPQPASAAVSNAMDYTPLSPPDTFQPDPPYDANDKEDTIEPQPAAPSNLPLKKRFRTQDDMDNSILFWFSSIPPQKIIVIRGNSSQEFVPKMD